MMSGENTWGEIVSQPGTWRAALASFAESEAALQAWLGGLGARQVVVVGCGSTYYLAQSASACLPRVAGVNAVALPSSELWLYPELAHPRTAALVAISRSGTTTETLWAVDRFRESGGGPVLAITCYPASTLAGQADIVLGIPAAQEHSIAQTRSFTSMLLTSLALAARMARSPSGLAPLHALPGALEDLMERIGDLPAKVGQDLSIREMVFLGGGALFGLASEAMLKTMEMSQTEARAFHPMEYRHGPMSLVGRDTLMVGLLSDTGAAREIGVLADLKKLGARTLVVAESASGLEDLKPDFLVELRSGLAEWERLPLYLPPLQHLAFQRAIAKGLDPDCPRNLKAVVELSAHKATGGV